GLNESQEVEIQLKDKYCRQFKDGFLISFDSQIATEMADFSNLTPDRVLGQHVAHLVRRINLLQGRLEGETLETLQGMPQPSYEPIVLMADQKVIPEIRKKFGNLYLRYLVWRLDPTSLNQEMNDLQAWLKHILTLRGIDLNWIVTWANDDESLSYVTLDDFWGGSLEASDDIVVPPVFTLDGKGLVHAFLKEIESALPDPLMIASQKLEFLGWYDKGYLRAWYDFATSFPQGVDTLKGKEEYQRVAARIAAGQGPYSSLLDTMTVALQPLAGGEDAPPWVTLVHELKDTKVQAAKEGPPEDKGALEKAAKKGKKLIAKLEKKVDKLEKKVGKLKPRRSLESQMIAAKAFHEYQMALSEIAPASASSNVAFQMATQAFIEDGTTSESPFFVAQRAVDTLKAYMVTSESADEMFWGLVTGPLAYLWSFVRLEAACRLQDLWEREVLIEIQGIYDEQTLSRVLWGEAGHATRFIEGTAAPFVSRSLKKGYHAKRVLGGRMPFEDAFLSFYTTGERAAKPMEAEYSVSISGLPTDANQGARLRPHATHLEVQCEKETKTLVNLNYPVKQTFTWSPMTCGDVMF
ncbi:MAG: type VI secretion system protein ImpL, partial [Thermodesulfobacteriota bacterium]|nr:type VI secretion system protein ImpL [Thermodesulfobacteriota bacterium]